MTPRTISGLYGICDSAYGGEDFLIDKASQLLKGGCRVIQYRDKDKFTDEKNEQIASKLNLMCQSHQAIFLLNDRVQLAYDIDASGVHLGQNDLPLKEARKLLGSNKLIGITCHGSIDLAKEAQRDGADYVAFGKFYASQTKPLAKTAEAGLISQAKSVINIPIVAIGGIKLDNADSLLKEGADAIAVINDLMTDSDTLTKTRSYQELIESY